MYSDLDYGYCQCDTYTVGLSFFSKMTQYYEKGFINQSEYDIIKSIEYTIPKKQIHYEIVKNILRSRYILRWNIEEIHQGFKILRDINNDNYKYYLENGVSEKSQINIEGIFINDDNKYIECSNFFVLEYTDIIGEHHLLNLSDTALYDTMNFRRENLKQSMYTLMYSDIQPNLFKAVKRMLSFGRSFKMIHLLELVYPLINSQLGALYQLYAQLKTIMKVLKEHGNKNIRLDSIYHQLDSIRFKIQDLIFLNYDTSDVINLITLVLSDEKITPLELYEKLSNITRNILNYLNSETKHKMIDTGIYPLPSYLVPSNPPF